MDDFPLHYVEHNLPLILLSGLDGAIPKDDSTSSHLPYQEKGARISAESPLVTGDKAQSLLDELLRNDATKLAWTVGAPPDAPRPLRFRIKPVGRTYHLPPRKAAPPPQSANISPPQSPQGSPPRSIELHSTLSPLSPSSPLFSDGVMTPLWFSKHQHHVPSAFLSFFELNADSTRSTAQDNQLKADINGIKTIFAHSGYKSRFFVILVSDRRILEAPELEDRLAGLRRATGLDPKSGLFFMPSTSSRPEIAAFVQSILMTLQPGCIEYYRDLTKHARRKKTRGSVPPPTAAPSRGSSQALSQQGWNARYEIKQGVFAEFRQEMDVAERHYSAAIDDMFNPEGVFESVPSWSPRWNEYRVLCDTVALRVIRCQLWHTFTTGAVQSWVNYRDRMKDLVDRRGKGSLTYGWEAWEARWSRAMAQLVERADLSAFRIPPKLIADDSVELLEDQVYCEPEKAFSAVERLPPFHFLHHPGYWHRLSATHTRERRRRALAIPEEDRLPPGQSPASKVANRVQVYDNYMVPDPPEESPLKGNDGFDHIGDITQSLNKATAAFDKHQQQRALDQTVLDLAKDLTEVGRYEDAMKILRRLWQETSWRRLQWYALGMELLLLLHSCAQELEDYEMLLATSWELLCDAFTLPLACKIDLAYCYDFPPSNGGVICSATFNNANVLCPISVSFAFGSTVAHVGDQLQCQLVLRSTARKDTVPVQLTAVEVHFDDKRTLRIERRDSDTSNDYFIDMIELVEDADDARPEHRYLRSQADLLLAPAEVRILNFALAYRETGLWRAVQASLEVHAEAFELNYWFSDELSIRSKAWWYSTGSDLRSKSIGPSQSTLVTVLPKPPKMQVRAHNLRDHYYIGETVSLAIELVNDEAEDANALLDLRVIGQSDAILDFHWDDDDTEGSGPDGAATSRPCHVGNVATCATMIRKATVIAPVVAADFMMGLEVRYHVASDPDTPLSKSTTFTLSFVSPFEANYDFTPLLHPEPWPSFFDTESLDTSREVESSMQNAKGIPQLWQLSAHVVSFASEALIIEGCELNVMSVVSDAICESTFIGSKTAADINLQGSHEAPFSLTTKKLSLDDRRPSTVELSLAVSWSRKPGVEGNLEAVTTTLAVPILTIPTSEPRVLCTMQQNGSQGDAARLHYHLENPSMHCLTFALTMEAAEDFAFNGSKYRNVSLAPLSRLAVNYELLPYEVAEQDAENGRWISPLLHVVDSYYQKTLRVQAAGANVKNDEKGNVAVWLEP